MSEVWTGFGLEVCCVNCNGPRCRSRSCPCHSERPALPGWRCAACGLMGNRGRSCDNCGGLREAHGVAPSAVQGVPK